MKGIAFFSFILLTVHPAHAQKNSAPILMDCMQADTIAKVIFFRPYKLLGSATGYTLYLKDSLQTKIRSNSFFVMDLPQGKHRLTAVTNNVDVLGTNTNTLDLNIEAGKIYFVKCSVKSFSQGITKPNFKLLFKVLNKKEIKKSLQKKFLRKHIQRNLYNDFYNQNT